MVHIRVGKMKNVCGELELMLKTAYEIVGSNTDQGVIKRSSVERVLDHHFVEASPIPTIIAL
jgi:hypothetical protein